MIITTAGIGADMVPEKTPLMLAVLRDDLQGIQSLLARGNNDINHTVLCGEGLRAGQCSALWYAAANRSIEGVRLLLEHGADRNARGIGKGTALYRSIRSAPMVKLLLQHGADVNIPDWPGNTPLFSAAMNSLTETVELLLTHGADVDKPTFPPASQSPLSLVASRGNVPMVRRLLAAGADPAKVRREDARKASRTPELVKLLGLKASKRVLKKQQ